MNEHREKSLYDILDKFSTKLVDYITLPVQTGDEDGMRISNTILHCRTGESYV